MLYSIGIHLKNEKKIRSKSREKMATKYISANEKHTYWARKLRKIADTPTITEILM